MLLTLLSIYVVTLDNRGPSINYAKPNEGVGVNVPKCGVKGRGSQYNHLTKQFYNISIKLNLVRRPAVLCCLNRLNIHLLSKERLVQPIAK